ncbi:hypothetical protein ScPMuIL_002937 [Solemya velum]
MFAVGHADYVIDLKKSLTRNNVGLYHIYLKEWFKVFPRKSTDIARSEKENDEAPIQNKKRYPDMMPKTRELLQHFYRPHNEQLVALLNDNNFNWNSDYASQSVV